PRGRVLALARPAKQRSRSARDYAARRAPGRSRAIRRSRYGGREFRLTARLRMRTRDRPCPCPRCAVTRHRSSWGRATQPVRTTTRSRAGPADAEQGEERCRKMVEVANADPETGAGSAQVNGVRACRKSLDESRRRERSALRLRHKPSVASRAAKRTELHRSRGTRGSNHLPPPVSRVGPLLTELTC